MQYRHLWCSYLDNDFNFFNQGNTVLSMQPIHASVCGDEKYFCIDENVAC